MLKSSSALLLCQKLELRSLNRTVFLDLLAVSCPYIYIYIKLEKYNNELGLCVQTSGTEIAEHV